MFCRKTLLKSKHFPRCFFSFLGGALFFLSSCGYSWDRQGVISSFSTLSVPYVKGDKDGRLTSTLVEKISSSGEITYLQNGGELVLAVEIISMEDEQVGYRKDREKEDGSLRKNVVPSEGRKTVVASVQLIDPKGEVLWGPKKIEASTDYDYVDEDSLQDLSFIDSVGQTETTLFFSAGQLGSIDSAQEAVLSPLYRKLAQKILDAIFYEEGESE